MPFLRRWTSPETKALLIFAVLAASFYVLYALLRPLAEITFKVSDDSGKPVAGVTVAMSTFHHWQPGEGFGKDVQATFTGVTNDQGMVTLSSRSWRGDFAFGPRAREGFYENDYREGAGTFQFKEVGFGTWKPWNPAIEITIKRILQPIPLFAKKMGHLRPFQVPARGKPVGFDLMKGDWVTPYGNGISPDLLFTLIEEIPFRSTTEPFATTLKMTFSRPDDGVQSVLIPLNPPSILRLPRFAPEEGYQPELIARIGREAADKPIIDHVRDDRGYFFRVRTTRDENGKITSACYGKLSGDVRVYGNGDIQFTYYLNPTSLDRNLEFDPNKNLFPHLSILQEVDDP